MAEPLTVEKLAEAVREHEQLPLSITYAPYPGCTCGWMYPATPRGEAMRGGDRDTDAWEKHQQEVLRPLVEAERAQVRADVVEEIAQAIEEHYDPARRLAAVVRRAATAPPRRPQPGRGQ
ncbi:MAG: hypothetical protein JWR88_1048 [Pseudonocardia sp.]|nr:hypothetical protein [Pseudonocardia sp.]